MKRTVLVAMLLTVASQVWAADVVRVPRSVVRQYLNNQPMPPPVMYQQPYQLAPVGCAAAPRDVVSAAFNSAVCAALLPFNVGQMMIIGAAGTVQSTTGIGR